MKTTVDISESLHDEARKIAAREKSSITKIILHEKTVLPRTVNDSSNLNCFEFDDIKDKIVLDDQ